MTPATGDGIQRLRQVAQRAADLDGAVEFYRDVLGAAFVAKFDPPGLAFFQLGDVRLLLEPAAPSTRLYFAVGDMHTAHRSLLGRGVVFEQEPLVVHRDDEGLFGPAGEEEWMAFFRDPAGNLLAITARH